ncbi:hypothetical protein ACKXGF_07525 [Alkalibacillus sp. S2W]|uniref:hypothetical protein n=1 Tax=Alkalibacillus sp. S2W TaxID=3386553 RepID=UPI00398D6627
MLREMRSEISIKNKISLYDVDEYDLYDCKDISKSYLRVFYQEKVIEEAIVSNPHVKNRRRLIDNLNKQIKKLYIKPREEKGSGGFEALKKFLGGSNKKDK